ncbi:MAG: activator of HSP90 ATPase 1 family protein [Lewinella sp.]|nr:activator of HSP90 ATPase 1 family protein [Lewinella sp.]
MDRVKFTQEFIFRASPTIVYQFLTTPACLTRWFCDEVDIDETTYTFAWSGAEEKAVLIDDDEPALLRFMWEDAESEREYLEFSIGVSEVTGETIMHITDFADVNEVDDQRALWASQMARMRAEMGG